MWAYKHLSLCIQFCNLLNRETELLLSHYFSNSKNSAADMIVVNNFSLSSFYMVRVLVVIGGSLQCNRSIVVLFILNSQCISYEYICVKLAIQHFIHFHASSVRTLWLIFSLSHTIHAYDPISFFTPIPLSIMSPYVCVCLYMHECAFICFIYSSIKQTWGEQSLQGSEFV